MTRSTIGVSAVEPAFPVSKAESDVFGARSTVLRNILRAGELTRIVAAYERENERAIDAQRRFSNVATHLNASVLATAVIGSLILALGLLQPWLQKDVEQAIPWALAALGFVGLLVGGAVAAFAAAQEAIGQERERAQRFRNNVDALELLARQIDDVRGAVSAGASEALVTFTGAINQQLALELGQFLEGGESIRASIAKLSQQIEKSRKEGKLESDRGRPKPD